MIRSRCPAPLFCETNVEIAMPIEMLGSAHNMNNFRAVVCPAITVAPRLLIPDCRITDPTLTTEPMNAIAYPCPASSTISAFPQFQSSLFGISILARAKI